MFKVLCALSNIIHKEWSGLTTAEHKKLKKLERENLRDHMSEAELLFTALAELSTREIAKGDSAEGFNENAHSAKKGGAIAGNARKQLESETGKPVVNNKNYLSNGKKKKLNIRSNASNLPGNIEV